MRLKIVKTTEGNLFVSCKNLCEVAKIETEDPNRWCKDALKEYSRELILGYDILDYIETEGRGFFIGLDMCRFITRINKEVSNIQFIRDEVDKAKEFRRKGLI